MDTALWLYLTGCLINLVSTIIETRNLSLLVSILPGKTSTFFKVALSQAGFQDRTVRYSYTILLTLLWHGRFIFLFYAVMHALRGVDGSRFAQFREIIVPRWTGFPLSLLCLAVLVDFKSRQGPFDFAGMASFVALTFSTILFLLTLGVVSFSKYVSLNRTRPMTNAIMTVVLMLVVAVLVATTALSQTTRQPSSALQGVIAVLSIWTIIADFGAKSVTPIINSGIPSPSASLYQVSSILVVILFYISTVRALISSAVVDRSDADHAALSNYYREIAELDRSEQHYRLISDDHKDKPVTGLMLNIARGKAGRADEAAGRLIKNHGRSDLPAHRHFLLGLYASAAIPDLATKKARSDCVEALLAHLVANGASANGIMLLIRNCVDGRHIDAVSCRALFTLLAGVEGIAGYEQHLELLLTLVSNSGDTSGIDEARRYIATEGRDLQIDALYFMPILVHWSAANDMFLQTGRMPAGGDRFPEAIDHLKSVVERVRTLAPEIPTALAASYFATLSFPMKLMQSLTIGGFVDDSAMQRSDDWQRQVSDDIINIDKFDMVRLARTTVV